MKQTSQERKDYLLKVCYEYFKQNEEYGVCQGEVSYDGTICDGYSIMEDIGIELGIEE